jgi:hypothetical protein
MRCMAGSRCRVSFADSEGVLHGIDVDAESLYEAVAIAVAQFRDDDVSPSSPAPMTEFTVAVSASHGAQDTLWTGYEMGRTYYQGRSGRDHEAAAGAAVAGGNLSGRNLPLFSDL